MIRSEIIKCVADSSTLVQLSITSLEEFNCIEKTNDFWVHDVRFFCQLQTFYPFCKSREFYNTVLKLKWLILYYLKMKRFGQFKKEISHGETIKFCTSAANFLIFSMLFLLTNKFAKIDFHVWKQHKKPLRRKLFKKAKR